MSFLRELKRGTADSSSDSREERHTNFKVYLLAIVGLVLFSQPLVILHNSIFHLLAVTLTMTMVVVSARGKVPFISLRASFLVLLFVFIAALSMVFSVSKRGTLSELVLLLCVVVTGIVVGNRISINSICHAVVWAGLLILGISVLVAIIFPTYGLQSGEYQAGSLRGIYSHRNQLAFTLTIPLIALVGMRVHSRWIKLPLAVLLFAGILSTNSSTGLVCSILALVMLLVLRFLMAFKTGYRTVPVILVLPAVALGLVAIYKGWEKILLFLGRDATFTGRSYIWAAVGEVSDREALFGYGWGAVWSGSWVQQYVSGVAGFYVPHAHNGYLDTRVQLGYVGLAVIVMILITILFQGISLLLRTGNTSYVFPPTCIMVYGVYNIFETRLTLPLSLFVLVILVSHCLKIRNRSKGGSVYDV